MLILCCNFFNLQRPRRGSTNRFCKEGLICSLSRGLQFQTVPRIYFEKCLKGIRRKGSQLIKCSVSLNFLIEQVSYLYEYLNNYHNEVESYRLMWFFVAGHPWIVDDRSRSYKKLGWKWFSCCL